MVEQAALATGGAHGEVGADLPGGLDAPAGARCSTDGGLLVVEQGAPATDGDPTVVEEARQRRLETR